MNFSAKRLGSFHPAFLNSKDGWRVINYSQWRSANDVAAFRQHPYFGLYIQRLQALSKAESIECEVVYIKSRLIWGMSLRASAIP
jgi:hypothetical protein